MTGRAADDPVAAGSRDVAELTPAAAEVRATDEVRVAAEAWVADEIDPVAASELRALLAAGAEAAAELADRFSGPLRFGTAGLRGRLRAGPNGMNRAVVRRAAAGLAAWLRTDGLSASAESAGGAPADEASTDADSARLGPGASTDSNSAARSPARVVIGYDARHGSQDFALDSAAVFAAAGLEALVLPRALPTPVLAFAVRHLVAQLGVMVTASHNPPQDNGYKVYLADGGQLVPPIDAEIEAAMTAVGPTRSIPLSDAYHVLSDEVLDAYVDAVAGLIDAGPRALRVVHTAMHGVGTETIVRVFGATGFEPLIPVAEQARPDPDFPTVAFPNPEEPGALELALALARDRDADIVIANDPDADRCAVAARFADGWRALRGDEVGVLLADALMRKGIRGTYATTIVSSTMLRIMAEQANVGYAETLTGFKWIVRAAPDLVYGYEEALGYAVAPHIVRDKDGISAALLVAELAAALKAVDSSLPERLDELAATYGRHATDQLSIRVDDLSQITRMMARLRSSPPDFAPDLTITDRLPAADVLTYSWPDGRVVVRPSGTEPKLKAYLEVVARDGTADTATRQLSLLRKQVRSILDA